MTNKIARGTTPSFIFSFNKTLISDIKEAVFVIKQDDITMIEIELKDGIKNQLANEITFTLTQEQSLHLKPGKIAVVYLDWLCGSVRGTSVEAAYQVINSGKDVVIAGGDDIEG